MARPRPVLDGASLCAVLALALSGCGSAVVSSTIISRPASGGLTDTQAVMAMRAVHEALSGEGGKGANITSATAVLSHGTTRLADSNTGHACTSGKVLNIRLIGSFPHITVAPPPAVPGHPPASTVVTAMGLRVDAGTGALCLIGVTTNPIQPAPNSTALKVG